MTEIITTLNIVVLVVHAIYTHKRLKRLEDK